MALHGHSFSNNSFVLAWTFIFPINYIGYHLRYNVWGERGGQNPPTTIQQIANRAFITNWFYKNCFFKPSVKHSNKIFILSLKHSNALNEKTSFNQCSPIFFLFNIYKIDICNVHIRKLTLVFITRISNQVQQLHHCRYQLGASG